MWVTDRAMKLKVSKILAGMCQGYPQGTRTFDIKCKIYTAGMFRDTRSGTRRGLPAWLLIKPHFCGYAGMFSSFLSLKEKGYYLSI
jgi:hypothetical protein